MNLAESLGRRGASSHPRHPPALSCPQDAIYTGLPGGVWPHGAKGQPFPCWQPPGKGSHSHSLVHGRSDPAGHHCPFLSSPDLPDTPATKLPENAVWLHTHGWETPGGVVLCSPGLPPCWYSHLTSAVPLLGDAQACSRDFWLWCHLRELLQGQQHSQLNICTIFLVRTCMLEPTLCLMTHKGNSCSEAGVPGCWQPQPGAARAPWCPCLFSNRS